MHFNLWVFVLLAVIFCHAQSAEIEEPQNYGPKVMPSNIPEARQALGYDKYERQPVDSSRKSDRKLYPYGNNWEQFDNYEGPRFSSDYRGRY